jgi:hypothetical protein
VLARQALYNFSHASSPALFVLSYFSDKSSLFCSGLAFASNLTDAFPLAEVTGTHPAIS